jgi:Fe-S cluster biogenesis protein NfuA
VRFEGDCNTTAAQSVTVTTLALSTAPTGINITNNNICQGTPKTLTVQGGSLGAGAVWKWYLDAGFTTSAGPDGASLVVDPSSNTTYYVRAEGTCNATAAASGTVLTGIPSIAPTSASSDRSNICPLDGNVVLSYTGGTLGDGATAEWYSDAAFTVSVGMGNNLTLAAPATTTTYYVRFEGDCNTTAAQSVTVTVKSVSTAPTAAASDRNNICPSDGSIVLSYSGGTLGDGATAEWYSDATFTVSVGTGNNVTLAAPATTTTYYVRIEGDCNTTPAQSVTVTVNPNPAPVIAGPAEACAPGSVVYSVPFSADHTYSWTISGGTLSAGAGTNSITVDYASALSGTVQVTETNSVTGCSGTSAVHSITVFDAPVINEIQSNNKLTRR